MQEGYKKGISVGGCRIVAGILCCNVACQIWRNVYDISGGGVEADIAQIVNITVLPHAGGSVRAAQTEYAGFGASTAET